MNKVQVFGYRIIKIESIDCLEKYKHHRRLSVFYHKGTTCCECDKKGTLLVYGKDKHNNTHVDLCTDDYYPLTIDHIVPKSKGGSSHISNLRPLCCGCNNKKADKIV
jgi:5-methylcytosine-specific restriction endonuclease McrA